MAAKVPNTHTSIFTNIPKKLTKTWRSEALDLESNSITAERADTHEMSIIDEIQLCVKFNSLITASTDTLDRIADTEFDAISVWQEARRDWADLEKSIETTVAEFIARSRERAAKSNIKSVDILTDVRTIADDEGNDTVKPIQFNRKLVIDNNLHPSVNSRVSSYAETIKTENSSSPPTHSQVIDTHHTRTSSSSRNRPSFRPVHVKQHRARGILNAFI